MNQTEESSKTPFYGAAKMFHYLVTGAQNWGRGATVQEAFKNARTSLQEKRIHCILHSMILKPDTTQEEMDQLAPCYVVDDWGSFVRATDCTDADHALIKDKLIAWAKTDYNKPKPKS